MSIGKRLKEIRYRIRASQQGLADQLGVSVYRVQNLESGKASTLTREEIEKLEEIGFSPLWLVDGTGGMYTPEGLHSGSKAVSYGRNTAGGPGELHEGSVGSVDAMLRSNDEDIAVWFYKYVNAAAGYGSEVLNEAREKYNFAKHALCQIKPHATNLSVVQVEGDSMEPQFRDGDQLFVDTSQNTLDREGIYVIRMRNTLLVKCVQIEPKGVRLISRNDHYRDISLEGDELCDNSDVAVIGRVLGAVTFIF